MRKLGTIDLEVLQLAIKENGTFNENHLENSEIKRHGVGKILDTLASLKDRKFISLNSDGSFTITELAREILWSSNIPIWGRILRLLQVKSCSLNQIIEVLASDEDKIIHEIEQELFNLEGRDAEFMYAVSSELMEKAELEGDIQAVEKYKILMEEARSCIPQLNLHGMWVGK